MLVLEKEVRLSQAILKSGYSMDCFNPHYAGVDWQHIDWRKEQKQKLNMKEFPYFLLWGTDLESIFSSLKVRNETGYQCYDPFETIFIKRSKFHQTRAIDKVFGSFYDRYRHYAQFNSLFDAASAKLP